MRRKRGLYPNAAQFGSVAGSSLPQNTGKAQPFPARPKPKAVPRIPAPSLSVFWSPGRLSRRLSSLRLPPRVCLCCRCRHWPRGCQGCGSPQTPWPALCKVGQESVSSFPWVYMYYPCGPSQVLFLSPKFPVLQDSLAPQPIPSFSPG